MVDATSTGDITQNVNSGNANPNAPNSNTQSSSGCIYDKWGRTPDKSQICAIGVKSAAADTQDGIVKCVFENKCAHCGKPALMWGWKWSNDPEKVQKFDGTDGVAEGHIYCVQSEGGCDADYSIEGNEHINGSTAKLTVVSGPTQSSEDEAQKLSSGQLACDGSTAGGSNSQGGGAVLIPDKTFYGLIKQMCGGIDGLFVIANNMAYLLSFKDIYEYRDKYDEFIPKIEAQNILSNSLDKNWSTDGLYNTVEVTYADGIIRYQNDALVQQYGQNIFYYEFPEDDEETAKAKADALLSAHIRDYGFDIYITTMYNPNITEGAWIKIPKKIANVSGFSRDEYEAQKSAKDNTQVGLVTKKHKGVTISDLAEIISETEWGDKKYIEKITDENNETYEIEVEKNEYELFFVNAYTLRWDKNHALIMDLHLKYGPDTPEDPENATIGSGGASSGSASATGGESADINEFVQKALKGVPNDERSKAEAIYKAMVAIVRYAYYGCSHYSTASECLQNAAHLNCADSSRLGRACYSAGGLQSHVVSGPNHFWVEVKINGSMVASDVTGSEGCACVRPLGQVYAGLTKTGDCGDNPSC